MVIRVSPTGGMLMEMKERGDFLGTRALGEEVRVQIISLLREKPDAKLTLDFTGVTGMSQSFADEAFRKILHAISKDEIARIRFQNLSEDVRSVLRYATSRKEVVAQ